jgi:hypothetical protein
MQHLEMIKCNTNLKKLQVLSPVDFSRNPHYEQKFRFYDQSLYDAVLSGNPDVHLFFKHLALCHTVMADERAGEYNKDSVARRLVNFSVL